MHFFMLLLRSFSRFFSSLGKLLLSSMGLRVACCKSPRVAVINYRGSLLKISSVRLLWVLGPASIAALCHPVLSCEQQLIVVCVSSRVSDICMCCERKGWSGRSLEREATVNILPPVS